MQSKFAYPVVLISLVAALAFAMQWVRELNRTHHLVIATASRDGEYFAFASVLAEVVNRHHPDIKIRVRETAGSVENMALLSRNQVQLAIVQSDTPVHSSVRAVAYLFPEVFHLLATEESGIEGMADLRGKRVALMPEGSGSYALFQAVSPHYGLNQTNYQAIALPADQASAALQQGQVDALFRVIALGSTSISQLLEPGQIRLIPIDQVEALRLSLPYLEATQIPKGTYSGAAPIPPDNIPVVAVRAELVAHESVNPEVIREVTRTLFERRSELIAQYPRAANIRLPESAENLGVLLHPGARAYYSQDNPNFWLEYAELIGLLLSVTVLSVSGFWQFRLWLLAGQKNRADRYNLEILELIEQVQMVNDLEHLYKIRHQLFEIFAHVVMDLDKDRISPESFQSFTFPWDVAITTIRHREMILLNLHHKS
ncbi:MAG: TAXI family TRAP transporter solute-binding subunit [Leptolyngbyaceae cyanobacterium RM1_406_9]|nr:TAXI family TRAP transporter solute-binding subunit [Leptolyngbyaceae cyanobacterium SM1_4_3]NJN90124.1 TAXI family TRAP transporter solute-binding subunit [Leptolyngbyaceae cyanobacterium SL_5_14]NJO73152.1 TAXI family TRAP transporter solute-binding subunit [Leptolyngbyaceae cyanobacterium RM1_406_9]